MRVHPNISQHVLNCYVSYKFVCSRSMHVECSIKINAVKHGTTKYIGLPDPTAYALHSHALVAAFYCPNLPPTAKAKGTGNKTAGQCGEGAVGRVHTLAGPDWLGSGGDRAALGGRYLQGQQHQPKHQIHHCPFAVNASKHTTRSTIC